MAWNVGGPLSEVNATVFPAIMRQSVPSFDESQSSTLPPARSLSEKVVDYINSITRLDPAFDRELAILHEGEGEYGEQSHITS